MVDLTNALNQDAMPLPSTAYPWRLRRRSLLLLPLFFASCMAPTENGLDPFKGGLMAELLMSFQPTVLATSGTTITELSASNLQPTGTSLSPSPCASLSGLAADSAGWRMVVGCGTTELRIIERRELPGRSIILGGTIIGPVAYDETTEIAVVITTTPAYVTAVDTRTATLLWEQTFSSDTPNSLAILPGRVAVGFSTTTGISPYLKAFDLRTGTEAGSFTSGDTFTAPTGFLRLAALPDKTGFVTAEQLDSITTLRLHDAQTLQPIWEADVTIELGSITPGAMAVNVEAGLIYVSDAVGNLHIFDLNSRAQLSQTPTFANPLTVLVYSRFMGRLYTADSMYGLYARDPLTGAQIGGPGISGATDLVVVPGDRY